MQLQTDLLRMATQQQTGRERRGALTNVKTPLGVLGAGLTPLTRGAGRQCWADDIGYFAFPITVDGKQYSPADEDYCFLVSMQTAMRQIRKRRMIFVKWMTEKSGYSYNEGGLPIAVGDDKLPEVYQEFTDNNVEVYLQRAGNRR